MRCHKVSGQPESGQWTLLKGVGLAWVWNGDVEHCKQVYPGDYGLQMWARNLLIMGGNESQRNFSLLWMLVELSGSPRLVDPRKVHCYTEKS